MEKIPSLLLGFTILFILLFAENIIKWFKGKPKTKDELFNEGYLEAMSSIKKGHNPTKLYHQCQTDDYWDRGWKKACKDNGAITQKSFLKCSNLTKK